MIAFLLPWLKSINLWLIVGAFSFGVFVTLNYEKRKDAAEMAELNLPLAEMRGKDEAEIPAEAARLDTAVKEAAAGVAQQCVITAETALALGRVK
jgi:hypothetical protein